MTQAPNGEVAFNASEWQALRTTQIRATSLLSEGYKVETTDTPGIYFVRRPVPLIKKDGTYIEGYTVDICQGTCSCPAFASLGDCKHKIAVLTSIAEAVALLGPLLPQPVKVTVPDHAPAPLSPSEIIRRQEYCYAARWQGGVTYNWALAPIQEATRIPSHCPGLRVFIIRWYEKDHRFAIYRSNRQGLMGPECTSEERTLLTELGLEATP